MHPSLQVWCVHLQLASSTQIHWTTTSIISYLHTPLSMRTGGSHSHSMADGISFSTLTTPREEGKKKLRTALNGTDCEADPGISNSKCISYIKSWISSEYDSMHIHFELKSQPEPRLRAVFFFFLGFILFNENVIWNYMNSPSFYCAKWRVKELHKNPIWIHSQNPITSHSKLGSSTVLFHTGGVGRVLVWGIYKL